MLYKLSNGRWSTVGDLAIYDVQTAGLAKLGYWVTESTTCECVILSGGGTLYQPVSHIDRDFLGIRCGMHFKDIAECLYNQDIPFYVLGAGCQQFSEDSVTRTSWRDLLDMTTGISVRDTWSKDKLVGDLQLSSDLADRIVVWPDPVFELYDRRAYYPVTTENIMISARYQTVEQILPAIDELRQRHRIVWCPMDSGDADNYRRFVQSQDLVQVSQFHGHYFADYRLYTNTLRNCMINITDRLHGVLFSIITGRSATLISHSANWKVAGQLSDLFRNDVYPFVCQRDSQDVLGCVQDLKSNDTLVSRKFLEIAGRAKCDALNHYKILHRRSDEKA